MTLLLDSIIRKIINVQLKKSRMKKRILKKSRITWVLPKSYCPQPNKAVCYWEMKK